MKKLKIYEAPGITQKYNNTLTASALEDIADTQPTATFTMERASETKNKDIWTLKTIMGGTEYNTKTLETNKKNWKETVEKFRHYCWDTLNNGVFKDYKRDE